MHFIYALAARLGVGIGEACDRIGMARSTPPRWKSKTVPRSEQLSRLRKSILQIAAERGTISNVQANDPSIEVVSADAMLAALAAARDVVTRIEIGLGIRSERK